MEILQNIIVMISKPLIVVIVVKLLVESGGILNLEVLFTVNIAMIIINMQAILNALAYIDLIKTSLSHIEEYMKA